MYAIANKNLLLNRSIVSHCINSYHVMCIEISSLDISLLRLSTTWKKVYWLFSCINDYYSIQNFEQINKSDIISLQRQITLVDAKRFKAIHPNEFRARGWEKKDAEKLRLSPNIHKFTSHFNQVYSILCFHRLLLTYCSSCYKYNENLITCIC